MSERMLEYCSRGSIKEEKEEDFFTLVSYKKHERYSIIIIAPLLRKAKLLKKRKMTIDGWFILFKGKKMKEDIAHTTYL